MDMHAWRVELHCSPTSPPREQDHMTDISRLLPTVVAHCARANVPGGGVRPPQVRPGPSVRLR